jgi:serine/threonine-protein kinase
VASRVPEVEMPELASAVRSSTPVPVPTLVLRPARPQPLAPKSFTPPTWVAHVRRSNGAGTVEVQCTALSRGGLFMCCAEPFPRLFTRLEFSLLLEGQSVECVGEVVRHVDPAQARSWDMRPGIGLQFVAPSPKLRELLQRLFPLRSTPP